eukprot:gene6882-4626_t
MGVPRPPPAAAAHRNAFGRKGALIEGKVVFYQIDQDNRRAGRR